MFQTTNQISVMIEQVHSASDSEGLLNKSTTHGLTITQLSILKHDSVSTQCLSIASWVGVSRNGKTYLKSSASALLKSTNRLDIDHSHSGHHPLLGPKVFMC